MHENYGRVNQQKLANYTVPVYKKFVVIKRENIHICTNYKNLPTNNA